MNIQVIKIFAAMVAGGFVMILHELPKSVLFIKLSTNRETKHQQGIFKIFNYIDPIGIILCITNQAGFSKPYMYRIKDRKTNFLLGVTGFLTLFVIFVTSVLVLKYQIGMDSDFTYSITTGLTELIYQCIVLYIALISLGMFLVNLFPISVFDMGLMIAGRSPRTYFSIIRFDYIIKIILLFAILLQLISYFSTAIISLILL
ncbi:MAG: hypothetical protein K0R92_1086 [Lachnospiraceae bacterium]|jgi:hypothetical protein|nr:hypothetical protein [Lachnospiraceae bacterium]